MESQEYLKEVATRIRVRVIVLRAQGKLTSKEELVSLAAIGRTCDPPVTRISVYDVVDGRRRTERIRRAIERELGESYWIRRKSGKPSAGRTKKK